MFHRGFGGRNRRPYGRNNFIQNQNITLPMPMPPPSPLPEASPVDPEFLRHTQTLPSLTWCETEAFRVSGAQPTDVPIMVVSKKLSKSRRKSKEERMAKEARKLKKQEHKLKLESIFIKSPTPERVSKPSTSKEKSEQPESLSGKEIMTKSDIVKKSSKIPEENSDIKSEKKFDDSRSKRISNDQEVSPDIQLLVEQAEEIRLEKSPALDIRRDKSAEKNPETSAPKKHDKTPEKHIRDTKLLKDTVKKSEKTSEKESDKDKKPEKIVEKRSDRKIQTKNEKHVEKERQFDKRLEKPSEKKTDKTVEKKVEKKYSEKKVEKPLVKKLEKLSEKKVEKFADKKLDQTIGKRHDKLSEKKPDKFIPKKTGVVFEMKFEKKSDNRSKSKSRPRFESPERRDSRSLTPIILDFNEVPASPKMEIDESIEIYKQDEVEEPQTPPIIEALSKHDGNDRKLSIFDRSPIGDSPKMDESLLGAELLKLNLENKLRELDAEEEDEMEEEQKIELDIFSEDSPKATESMKTIWSIHPNNFNIPIKVKSASLYDDDILSPKKEVEQTSINMNIDKVVKHVKKEEPSTVHVINSLENLQVSYAEEDDEDTEIPLSVKLLKLPPVEWDDEFSNSSYTKLCDEIEKHKSMMQEKGQKELLKEIQKSDVVKESQDELETEIKNEPENEQPEESVMMQLEPKIEIVQAIPKEIILNNEYEAFIKLLDETDTSEKPPVGERRSRSESGSSQSSSRSSSSSSSTSSSSTSSSSSSSSSNSSDSSSSSSSSSGSTSSSASESSPQYENNDVLKRALEKIMEIIPANYDVGDRSGFNPEELKNEILKILQSDANLNKKMLNVEIKHESRKVEQPKFCQQTLELGQSKIWNISTDSDEILTASPAKIPPKLKSPERSSKHLCNSDRKSRKQTSDYRNRSSSRHKYRKQRSRDRSRDYYGNRRSSLRKRSKSPRRRKSRSPVVKERPRKISPLEPRISPKSNKWVDNVPYLADPSYISNYGFRPPSPKEPSLSEQEFQYPEISSSSWNSDPSIQYCSYPLANADSSPQRISLDERIDMALGISNNETHHPTYYNYPSEGYLPHNEAYNTPIYNQYYHQYKAIPPPMTTYPVPPPPIHHNYYPPTYAGHPQAPPPMSLVQHQNSPFLNRNISTPPIHHQPSPQSSQKASFAVQVGNVLEIIPSELPTQSIELLKPPIVKPVKITQSASPQQPMSSNNKTAEQIISDAVDQRKHQRDQKRFTKKLRKEKLKLEISKLINLSNSMKIAENLASNVEDTDSNEVSTTFEPTTNAIELGKPERGILRQGEKIGAVGRKKVMFHDGIEPGNGTSTTDDEIIPPEKLKKKKKRRYSSNKENIALINQLLGTTRENSMNPEKPPEPSQPVEPEVYEDNLPPPPPPSGSPPPNCLQPKLKNPPPPEYLYFHLNPNENRLILTPYRPQIFHMQNRFAQLQQLMTQPTQRPPAPPVEPQPSLPFNIPSRLDGLLSDPRFAKAINALSNSLPLLRLPIVAEPKIESKPATPPTSGGPGRDETTKKPGTYTNL